MIIVIYLLLIINLIDALISFICFIPISTRKNEENEYNEEFKKAYPFLSYWSWPFLVVPVAYFIFYFAFSTIDFTLGDLDKFEPLIYMSCFSVAFIFVQTIATIINHKSHKTDKNLKLGFAVYLYIISSSIISGITLVHFGNYALDSSFGEEHIVSIVFSQHYDSGGTSEKPLHQRKDNTDNVYHSAEIHHYKVSFSPEVKDFSELNVPKEVQENAKINDKLKLYVKNGYFGLPFISSNRILIKQSRNPK